MTTEAQEKALRQEYDRLYDEHGDLQAQGRKDGRLDPEAAERYRQVKTRLREILATPPAGYQLPKPAADLVAHAEAHGWLALVQWTPPCWHSEPHVEVQVGRKLTADEAAEHRSDTFVYQLTWHSRDCAPGGLRRFGRILARTPDRPGWHDAPSIKAIRAAIEASPAPGTPRPATTEAAETHEQLSLLDL